MANTTGIEEINVGGTPYEVVDAAVRKMISDEYNSAENYAKGNLCIYSGKIYEAIKETTGTWDTTAWKETTLAEVNATMRSDITNLNEKTLKIRVKKSLSTGEWQGQDTVKSIDTKIDSMPNDIPVIYLNNSADSSKLTFIPCLKDNHWYISSDCSIPSGGGPDSIMFIVLNV